MTLPPDIEALPEQTTVAGDIEGFFDALESGELAQGWEENCRQAQRNLDAELGRVFRESL